MFAIKKWFSRFKAQRQEKKIASVRNCPGVVTPELVRNQVIAKYPYFRQMF